MPGCRCRRDTKATKMYKDELEALHRDKATLKDCIMAVVEQYPDGYIQCVLVENMGCEECYVVLERRAEMYEMD